MTKDYYITTVKYLQALEKNGSIASWECKWNEEKEEYTFITNPVLKEKSDTNFELFIEGSDLFLSTAVLSSNNVNIGV